jgi:hypothetical protein
MDRETVINKVRKCLALAASANEHEAAVAMGQAQKLMAKYGLEHYEVSGVAEARVKSANLKNPPRWEADLAAMVAESYGCRAYFLTGHRQWIIVGVDPAAEIASYAYSVLLRQIKAARAVYRAKHCKRLIRASQIRRADLFCEAWVKTVATLVDKFAQTIQTREAIRSYVLDTYKISGELEPIDRQEGKKFTKGDVAAWHAGKAAGAEATLHHGVSDDPLAIE